MYLELLDLWALASIMSAAKRNKCSLGLFDITFSLAHFLWTTYFILRVSADFDLERPLILEIHLVINAIG